MRPAHASVEVRNEDLKIGDIIVLWFGTRRITSIRPYAGPLSDIIFAIASYEPGPIGGISLERGGRMEVVP